MNAGAHAPRPPLAPVRPSVRISSTARSRHGIQKPGERMGANRSGKRLGGIPLVRKDARLRAGQDHRRLRLAVYVLCTAWGDASSPAASERFVPVVCGLTRPAMFSCRGNLPRDRTQRAGDGPRILVRLAAWPLSTATES